MPLQIYILTISVPPGFHCHPAPTVQSTVQFCFKSVQYAILPIIQSGDFCQDEINANHNLQRKSYEYEYT